MRRERNSKALGYTRIRKGTAALMAAGVLLLCACAELQKPDTDGGSSGQTIVFDTPIVEPSTKSDPFTTERNVIYGSTYPTNWHFVVGAVHYDGTFADTGWQLQDTYFPPTEMIYTVFGTKRGWTSTRSWPRSGCLAFSAYSPELNNGTYSGAGIDSQGVRFVDYSLATDGTQMDLLYSNRMVDQSQGSFTPGLTYDGVQLQFRHALASLVFTARTAIELDDAVIRVTGIELKGVKVRGSFAQNLGIYDTNGNAAAWTIPADAQAVDYANIVAPDGVRIDHQASPSWESPYVKDLLVMPQSFGDATISITYTIQTSEEAGSIPQSFSVRLADLLYTQQGETSPTAGYNAFEMGKRYVFNIEIGLQKIRFLPVVSSWGQTSI